VEMVSICTLEMRCFKKVTPSVRCMMVYRCCSTVRVARASLVRELERNANIVIKFCTWQPPSTKYCTAAACQSIKDMEPYIVMWFQVGVIDCASFIVTVAAAEAPAIFSALVASKQLFLL
jgi:hypothetical protein